MKSAETNKLVVTFLYIYTFKCQYNKDAFMIFEKI